MARKENLCLECFAGIEYEFTDGRGGGMRPCTDTPGQCFLEYIRERGAAARVGAGMCQKNPQFNDNNNPSHN